MTRHAHRQAGQLARMPADELAQRIIDAFGRTGMRS